MKTVILTCILFVISTNAIPVANHLRFASEKRAIGDSCGSGGTCKDENECGGEMKLAKSGLCPHDPANIKCCLTPNTCSLSSGQNGVCIERSHCTAAGKTPESGKCPRDGASILCCPSSDQMSIPSEGQRRRSKETRKSRMTATKSQLNTGQEAKVLWIFLLTKKTTRSRKVQLVPFRECMMRRKQRELR